MGDEAEVVLCSFKEFVKIEPYIASCFNQNYQYGKLPFISISVINNYSSDEVLFLGTIVNLTRPFLDALTKSVCQSLYNR